MSTTALTFRLPLKIKALALLLLISASLLVNSLSGDIFLDSPTQLSPFIEQNVLGAVSPALLTTSPSLYHNRAFSAFAKQNDVTFAYHPTDLPDVFTGGLAFNQSVDPIFFISGSAQVYLVGSLQNISDASFLRFGDFSYLNFTPSFTLKILPGWAVALQSEFSFFTVLGERKSDFNFGLSSAFEVTTKSTLFKTLRLGVNGRNILGLTSANMLPFEVLGSFGFISSRGVFSSGVGVNYRPKLGSALESLFSFDLGASLLMFDLWRFNVGVVGIGQNTVNLNVSTSVDISLIRLSYGLQNLIPTQGVLTRGSGPDQVLSLAVFYKVVEPNKTAAITPTQEDPQLKKNRELEALGEVGRKLYLAQNYFDSRNTFLEIIKRDAKNEMARQYLIKIEETLAQLKNKAVDEALGFISAEDYGKAMEPITLAAMVSPTDSGIAETQSQITELLIGKFSGKDNFETFLKGLKLSILHHDDEALETWQALLESQAENAIFIYYYNKTKARLALKK